MVENSSMALLCDVVGASQKLGIGAETFPQCATTLYNFASCLKFEELLVDQGALTALKMLGEDDTCSSLIAASLYLLSLHATNREKLVENGIPDLLLRLADLDDQATVQNCSGTFFMLSKTIQIRERLVEAGMVP